jgi:hypothetical protein
MDQIVYGSPSKSAELLIAATETGTAYDRYFDTLLLRAKERIHPLDNQLLGSTFEIRFVDGWTPDLPSGELQILLWLAECNKRMCFDSPERRAQQRTALLDLLREKLKATTDAAEICAILRVIYSTTFYDREVIPRDGADAIIDFFKDYVGNPDQDVHRLARSKLAWMGFVCQDRYDEILQFLVENAPEQHLYLDENALPGVKIDKLTGLTGSRRCVTEEVYLSLIDAPPERLASLAVEHRDSSFPNGDIVTETAIQRLIFDGTRAGGTPAAVELTNLMRKGIRIDTTLYSVCQRAAGTLAPSDVEAARHCFDAALHVYETTEENHWPRELYEVRAGLLTSLRSVVQTNFDFGSNSKLLQYITDELAKSIQNINASTKNRAGVSNTGPQYHQVTTIAVGNGTVTPESGLFLEGTEVEFRAAPDPNWAFDYWNGELPGGTNWHLEHTAATISRAMRVYAVFIERPGLTDLDMVGDLDYFLQAVGQSETAATFDRNEVEFDSEGRVYVGNGILDAAELYLLETVLKTRHLDWTAQSAIAHEPVWAAWRTNLTQATLDLNGFDPRIVRIVAAYMTLGDFDTQASMRDLVHRAFPDVEIDHVDYDRSSQRYFHWDNDADNDGVWNIEEWQAVSPTNSLEDIEAYAAAALDGKAYYDEQESPAVDR